MDVTAITSATSAGIIGPGGPPILAPPILAPPILEPSATAA
jgi:hypothetical protein